MNDTLTNGTPANDTPANDTFSRVLHVVVKQLNVEPEKVKPESHFQNDLAADSLDTVELVMALEEEFRIDIPDEDSMNIATVGDAVAYINKKLSVTV
ncbi:MAG: acyl carrier protein [Pseudanabaenaceae cyanobacterium]